jgi:FMN-dependent NADH-azoreductase
MVNLIQEEALLNLIENKKKRLEAYAQNANANQYTIDKENAELAYLTEIYNKFDEVDKYQIAYYVFNEMVHAALKVNPDATKMIIYFDFSFDCENLIIKNYWANGF